MVILVITETAAAAAALIGGGRFSLTEMVLFFVGESVHINSFRVPG